MYGKVITKALMSKGTVKFLITAKRVLRRPKRECRGHLKPELSNQKVSSKQNVGNGAKERTKSYWRVEEAAKHSSRSACGVQDIQDNAVVFQFQHSSNEREQFWETTGIGVVDSRQQGTRRGPWPVGTTVSFDKSAGLSPQELRDAGVQSVQYWLRFYMLCWSRGLRTRSPRSLGPARSPDLGLLNTEDTHADADA